MYKLYRQPNGQIEQVPINDPTEDQFPNPLEAKGEESGVAPFVIQEQKQFDIIKQNETDQAKFQTKKLQNSNYQIINFLVQPSDSGASSDFINENYNRDTAVGTALDAGVLFGTETADVSKAKYYNIVYANARFSSAGVGGGIIYPSYIEFYPMQKIPTGDFGGKIPRQIEAVANSTGVLSINTSGTQFGVQSFGVDIVAENAYYSQSEDIKGIRCCGLALKKLNVTLTTATPLSNYNIELEIGIDLNTEGNNY